MNKYKCKDYIILRFKVSKDKLKSSSLRNIVMNKVYSFNRFLFNEFSDISEYEMFIKYNPPIFSFTDCMARVFLYSTGVIYEKCSNGIVYIIPKDREDVADYIRKNIPHSEYLYQMKKMGGLDWSVNHSEGLNRRFFSDMEKITNVDSLIKKDNLLGYQEYLVKERKRKIENIISE